MPSDVLLIPEKTHMLELLLVVQSKNRQNGDFSDALEELEDYLRIIASRFELSARRKGIVQAFLEKE